jgi:hypothetical protein
MPKETNEKGFQIVVVDIRKVEDIDIQIEFPYNRKAQARFPNSRWFIQQIASLVRNTVFRISFSSR